MPTLDLYKNRNYSVIKLGDGKEYKVPTEYTVEEIERLLELRVAQQKKQKEEVDEEMKEAQLYNFWKIIFEQIEIIFQRFQPELKAEDLKKIITQNEALEILGFFQEYRNLSTVNSVDTKKKA
jgi:hypothetical protein